MKGKVNQGKTRKGLKKSKEERRKEKSEYVKQRNKQMGAYKGETMITLQKDGK